MLLQLARRYSVVSLTGLVMVATFQPPASGAAPADIIYLESNSTSGNSIFAYRFDFTSSPALISTTPAGGIGIFDPTFALGPFDSDQNLIENASGTLLFAVNSGSNTIAVFNIQPDGSLAAVNGSPFPSGGSEPVSLGLKDDILAVVNKDQDPAQNANLALQPNYTTFRVLPDGELVPVSQSTVSVAAGSSPSIALTASVGNLLFGADLLGGLLQSFRLNPQGNLDQNLPQALPASLQTSGHLLEGMRTHPSLPILYVGIVLQHEVAVYTYDNSGRLSFVRAVPDPGLLPCWAIVNHSGTRLYVTNTGSNSIAVYSLADPQNPVEIQDFTLANTTGAPFSTVIDHSDNWIYVSSEQDSASATPSGNAFHTLRVAADGTLTEPFPATILPITGTNPVRAQGITVF